MSAGVVPEFGLRCTEGREHALEELVTLQVQSVGVGEVQPSAVCVRRRGLGARHLAATSGSTVGET